MANYCRAHKRVTLVYFPELRSNEDNKHQDNARASSETVRHAECTYIILFLTRHNETINGDKIRRTSRIDSVSPSLYILLMTPQLTTERCTIVMRAHEKWYLTHYIPILFTVIFTVDRVRIIELLTTHSSDVTRVSWRLRWLSTRLLAQQLVWCVRKTWMMCTGPS